MARLNICFISKEMPPFYFGGIGVQFQLLMHFLRDSGHTIHFVTREPECLPEGWQQHSYDGIGVHFVANAKTSLSGHTALKYSVLVSDSVSRLAKTTQIDLIVAAEFDAESFGLLMNTPRNQAGQEIPVIVTLNGPSAQILRNNGRTVSAYDAVVCAMEDTVIRRANMLISPSERLWSELSDSLHLEHHPHRIIPNFCDQSVFHRAREIEAASPKRIAYVGRLQRVKGVDLLIEAFSRVATRILDCELVIIGRDLEWPEYQKTFTGYWRERLPSPLLDRIRFTGAIPPTEVATELARAWIAVFPSRWEAFGIAALESLSMGVPVIVSQRTGLAEVVGDEYPLTVDVSQGIESLSAQIERILLDGELRARLANEAVSRAEALQRMAIERWSLLFSQNSIQGGSGILSATALESVFLALNTYIAERDALVDVRSGESKERDRIIDQQHGHILARDDRMRLLEENLQSLTAEVLARDQLIATKDQLIATKDQLIATKDQLITVQVKHVTDSDNVIAAKDVLLEQQRSELCNLVDEVSVRDALLQTKDRLIDDLKDEIDAKSRELHQTSQLLTASSSELTETKGRVRNLTEHWLVRIGSKLKLID